MIRFLALGAGQDVGRSCIIVSMGGCNVMFDCGMHMGYNDQRRFPDFTLLGDPNALTSVIDCVIISHFHLDHCGALPYLTEQCGYRGPVLMTHPTKALAPILLEDYRKITVERRGEANFFTREMLKSCMERVTPLLLDETFLLSGLKNGRRLEVTPQYAGHVLGAAMFHVRVVESIHDFRLSKNYPDVTENISHLSSIGDGLTSSKVDVASTSNLAEHDNNGFDDISDTRLGESVLYTGDYNMTADRHLGPARAKFLSRPDVLITESTYATTLRDSKRRREAEFLRNVQECVLNGGKVLIPVFALGRVQELCVLLESFWEQMGLSSIPVYFSAGMAECANAYYKVYVDWTNERLKSDYPVRNLFEFKFVKQFQKHYADMPGPMVLFSSPGMLHSGMSLEIFKRWCGDDRNLLIIPGFCVSGTVGAKLLAGQRKIEFDEPDGGPPVLVKMQVKNMSFSAHADARGIMQMIKSTSPRSVVLVHGEAPKMAILKVQIIREFAIPCYDPPNGTMINLPSSLDVPMAFKALPGLIENAYHNLESYAKQLESTFGGPTSDGSGSGRSAKLERILLQLALKRSSSIFQIPEGEFKLNWDPESLGIPEISSANGGSGSSTDGSGQGIMFRAFLNVKENAQNWLKKVASSLESKIDYPTLLTEDLLWVGPIKISSSDSSAENRLSGGEVADDDGEITDNGETRIEFSCRCDQLSELCEVLDILLDENLG